MKETPAARKLRQEAELDQFVSVLRRAGNIVDAEVQVCASRKWRVDFLLPGIPRAVSPWHAPIAIEVQGFGFGHVGRAGWLRDIEKCAAIAANGWLYCPVTRDDIANGNALEALARCGVRVESV